MRDPGCAGLRLARAANGARRAGLNGNRPVPDGRAWVEPQTCFSGRQKSSEVRVAVSAADRRHSAQCDATVEAADPGVPALLARYERARRPDDLLVLWAIDVLGRLFSTDNRVMRAV